MNLSAIFSKTGKGVQEASGKTSHLSRADRSVLSAIDGKTSLSEVQKKFEKLTGPKFEALIQQLDKDGFIREVSSGASQQPAAPVGRTPPPPPRAAPPKGPAADSGEDSGLDFTQAIKVPPSKAPGAPPKAPPVDLAAASRAESERKAKEQEAFDYKARQEAEAKAQAEAKAREAAAHARARAETEAKARAETEAKARAEADAKVRAAREAAVRMATEANAKAGAADRERQAAEERARKEAEDKARLEAELNAKLAEERKAREDAERRANEAAELARRELEEKARRDAEEMRQRLEAEMKAKLEEERKAREAEDRKRREEEDRRRREEDERRAKEEAERKAREAEERKRREEEDRKRREEDERRRKDEQERRAKEEAERKAREAEDRKRREEEERKRREDDERRRKEDGERRAKEEDERRARDEQDRKRRKEDDERRAKEDAEAKSRAAPAQPAAPTPAAGGDIGDSLLADLESFSQREEEESRAKEEAARKAKEEAARNAKDEAERQAKEDAERKRREDEERRRKEDEARRAREEAERLAREEEERIKQEEADRKRKAKESLAAKKAEERAAARGASRPSAAGEDDIGVTDEDLDMDDVKRDHKVLAKAAKKPEFEQGQSSAAAAAKPVRRPVKWGKPAAIAVFVLLIGGVGLLNVMPVSTSDYEKAASEAMGVPVKIGSARLAALAGIEVRFENVSIGDSVKIRLVRGSPEVGSLFGDKKSFSRMELEGASIPQAQLAGAVLGKVAGENFRVERIVLKQAKFDGPVALPALDVEVVVAGDGALQSVSARGGDKLVVQLSPKGSDIGFEISAGSLALPFVPALTLSDFGWKGSANRNGVTGSEFDGRVYEGVLSGTAKVRWGGSWTVEGEVKARGLKVGVFAPALVSEGKIEGKGSYSMSGSVPASLFESARVQGDFKIDKGVLGSFNLTRALQTGGAQSTGRTEFSELTGQAVYDKGAIQIRNASISAGAMNAGVSLDIDAGGALAGRVAADVKTPTQTLRATLSISGKITDPVVRK